jgi:hypothetical protein
LFNMPADIRNFFGGGPKASQGSQASQKDEKPKKPPKKTGRASRVVDFLLVTNLTFADLRRLPQSRQQRR